MKGYWKTLIDRSMYNNDGAYHEQRAIDVTNFKADYTLREPSIKGIEMPSVLNDPTKTEAIAEKSAKQVAEGRGEKYEGGKRSSLDGDFIPDEVIFSARHSELISNGD